MRNAVSGMMVIQGMQVFADFAAHLDQVVLTGDARIRLNNGFMVALGRGIDLSPSKTRLQPPTAADTIHDAKAAAAFALAEAEVARVARQATADKAASEAKLAQEAAAASTILAEKAAAEAK